MTDDQTGPALRLLRQGEWAGDDGERSGKSIDDVRFASQVGLDEARGILETRLGVLVRMGRWEAFRILSVEADGGHVAAELERTLPGQLPEAVQMRVRDA